MLFNKKNKETVIIDLDRNYLVIRKIKNDIRIARIQCCINEDNTILISDIIHDNTKDYNKGYGSEMMNKLIEYAQENGYKELIGNLSTVDNNHKDRLHHFYKKFGFEIIVYDQPQNNYYGEIRKRIKDNI